MNHSVCVAGVGMIPFMKAGASKQYDEMAAQAVREALNDAGISYGQVPQIYAGHTFGKYVADGELCAKVALKCANQYGEDKFVADAVLALL